LAVSLPAQPPTIPASNIQFTFVGCNEFIATWNNGNGSNRVVFVRESSSFSDTPVQSEFYTDNSVFGKGESIKNDTLHYCVYNGTGSTVRVTGLKNLTIYFVAVFEYNNGSGNSSYLTSTFPTKDTITKNIVADFTLTPTSQCINGNITTFKNKSYCDLSPLSFTWQFGDGDSSNFNEPKHTYKTPGKKKITLISKGPGCYNYITLNDTINTHPKAAFDLDPNYLPRNKGVQCLLSNKFNFNNKTTMLVDIGGVPRINYKWYIEPDALPFANGYKAELTFTTQGTKTIKLVSLASNGCGDSTYRTYNVILGGMDISKVNISPKSMYLKDNQFTFTNNSAGFVKNKWYLRKKNETTNFDSVFGKNVVYSFKQAGWYFVSTSNDSSNNCIDTFMQLVEVKNDPGLLNESKIQSISIYPNPSKNGIFYIKNLPNNSSLSIYNIIGKEVLKSEPKHSNSEINLTQFGAGTYILCLWNDGRKFDYRLVVLKP
jgi:hypothetical protein